MTLEETADYISEGLPAWQRDTNLDWLRTVHGSLTLDGLWVYPDADLAFQKTEEGFDLVEFDYDEETKH